MRGRLSEKIWCRDRSSGKAHYFNPKCLPFLLFLLLLNNSALYLGCRRSSGPGSKRPAKMRITQLSRVKLSTRKRFQKFIISQLDTASKHNPDELSSDCSLTYANDALKNCRRSRRRGCGTAHNVLTDADENAILFYNDLNFTSDSSVKASCSLNTFYLEAETRRCGGDSGAYARVFIASKIQCERPCF
jgi:hypothetical protein